MKTTKEWHDIDCKQCYSKVFNIQEEIVKAYKSGDLQKVFRKQRLNAD